MKIIFNLFIILCFSFSVFAYDPEDLKKLKLTNECLKCDFSHADLRNTNLKNSVLESANFKGAIGEVLFERFIQEHGLMVEKEKDEDKKMSMNRS